MRFPLFAAFLFAAMLATSTATAGKIPIYLDETTGAVASNIDFTGTVTFSGGSIELVNATSVTVNAAGEIALDTNGDANITQGIVTYYDGTQQLYLAATDATPSTNGTVLTYSSASNKLTWSWPGTVREIWIGADQFLADSVAPPALANETTNINAPTYGFDAAADEILWYTLSLPDAWDRGTIKLRFYWYSAAATTGDCVFTVSSIASGDGDTFRTAPSGTTSLTATTDGTAGDLNIDATAAHTIQGTPALHDIITLQITRDADNVADTLAGDALLLGIKIQYTEATTAPAAW